MDWDLMKQRLESILAAPVELAVMSSEQWLRLGGQAHPICGTSVSARGDIWFVLNELENQLTILRIPEGMLTLSEQRLVQMVIETGKSSSSTSGVQELDFHKNESIDGAELLLNWLLEQLKQQRRHVLIPDEISIQAGLGMLHVPFMLAVERAQTNIYTDMEIKRLLESFFVAPILFISLDEREALILAPASLLHADEDDREEERDSMEHKLEALANGLHEMIANESLGECRIAVSRPIQPAAQLLDTIYALRDTLEVGREFDYKCSIHFPWRLEVARLLNTVPREHMADFCENVLHIGKHGLDTEIETTLERFFASGCNVSETAKSLYIHRNTLLYRLDKFKGETGLDVREFEDALQVKIAIDLYNVTKRK
jgi:hypothetical protein